MILYIQEHNVNLLHIESRPSKAFSKHYDFLIDADNQTGGLKATIEKLQAELFHVKVLSRKHGDVKGEGLKILALIPTIVRVRSGLCHLLHYFYVVNLLLNFSHLDGPR